MAAILGEFRNASANDIDASIADVTTRLNEATQKYNEAIKGIALCDNKALGCVKKSGRHISTWREWRDNYGPQVTALKKELAELIELKKNMATSYVESAQSSIVVAQAEKAVAEAESVKTGASAKKYLLVGGIILVALIGGIIAYKKLKK